MRWRPVRAARGDLTGALAAYRDAMAITERLAARDPGNAEWQRDLFVGNWRVGDVLLRLDRQAEARGFAETALKAAREWGRRQPDDARRESDLRAAEALVRRAGVTIDP